MEIRKALYSTIALIGISLIISLVAWFLLPSRVATHFDASGSPNAYGPKSDVLMIGPGLMTLVALISFGFCSISQEGIEDSGIEPYLGVLLVVAQVVLLGVGIWLLLKAAGR